MNINLKLEESETLDPGIAPPLVSWPFFQLEFEKCIKCMQCVRICDEVQHREVYTIDESGYPVLVSGTNDFRDTECNNCGQCVSVCPTGALADLSDRSTKAPVGHTPTHWPQLLQSVSRKSLVPLTSTG